MKKREDWIDVLRGIAILAVVYTHSFYFFPQLNNSLVRMHALFSVSWFIFLSGFSNALSFCNKEGKFVRKSFRYWKRRFTLIILYIITTVSYVLFYNWGSPGKLDLVSSLFNFSAHQQLYFIQLILQLYLVFPFLFMLMQKLRGNLFLQLVFLVIIGFITLQIRSVLQPPWERQSFFMPLSGAFLLIFTAGIFFFMHHKVIEKLVLVLSLPVFVFLEINFVSTKGGFITFYPTIKQMFWSISLLMLLKTIIERVDKDNQIIRLLLLLGKKSTYIYLFHFLMLEFLTKAVFTPNYLLYGFYFGLSVVFSLLVEYLLEYLSRFTRFHLAS